MELVFISTQFEVVVEVWLEKVLKRNFHGWVVGGWLVGWVVVAGWLDQVGIKLSQLSTKLKLKLKLSLGIQT